MRQSRWRDIARAFGKPAAPRFIVLLGLALGVVVWRVAAKSQLTAADLP